MSYQLHAPAVLLREKELHVCMAQVTGRVQPAENDGRTDIEPWLATVTLLIYPKN
jgi:hypothetical protein